MIRNPESGECAVSYLTFVPMKSHRTQECLRKRTVEVAFLVNEGASNQRENRRAGTGGKRAGQSPGTLLQSGALDNCIILQDFTSISYLL